MGVAAGGVDLDQADDETVDADRLEENEGEHLLGVLAVRTEWDQSHAETRGETGEPDGEASEEEARGTGEVGDGVSRGDDHGNDETVDGVESSHDDRGHLPRTRGVKGRATSDVERRVLGELTLTGALSLGGKDGFGNVAGGTTGTKRRETNRSACTSGWEEGSEYVSERHCRGS